MSVHQKTTAGYEQDSDGRLVLIGLSLAETFEFESLDARLPVDQAGQYLSLPYEMESLSGEERCWLEFYLEHWAAYEHLHKR